MTNMDRTVNGRNGNGNSLVDVLDRVLDKGIVIAGDVQINLLNIELLTIKIRLLITSVDKARELGINWWASDPYYTRRALSEGQPEQQSLGERCRLLEAKVDQLSAQLAGDKTDAIIDEKGL